MASAVFVGRGAAANETVIRGAAANETVIRGAAANETITGGAAANEPFRSPYPAPVSPAVDAIGRVTRVETTNVDGIFETVVELAPERCARPEGCPARVRAHAWGGTLDGITQVVGEMPAPQVQDEVDLSLARTALDVQATVLAVRRP
jgi:hypothetical protein